MDDILTTLCTLVDSERPNQVLFGSDVFKPTGYLAYSAPGKVQVSLKFRSEGQINSDLLFFSCVECSGLSELCLSS